MTIFNDDLFIKSELITLDGKRIICTLRDNLSGRYLSELTNSDSKGFCVGRMIDPFVLPGWMIPGTIFKSDIQGLKVTLTLQPSIQSRISELQSILGDKVRFSYMIVSEFT